MVTGARAAAVAGAAWPSLAVGALVVVVGWAGLLPGVGYWDTGEFQAVLPVLGTAHPTGYPTYVILGFLANLVLVPLGEPAFRISVLSLLCIAAAAGLLTGLVRRLGAGTAIAVAVGLGFAATPIAWQNATRADPHTLHVALVALLLVLLVRWEDARRDDPTRADRWLLGAAVVFGLSVGNHSLTLLLAAPVGLYVLAVDPRAVLRPGLVFRCAALLAATVVLVYLELPLRAGPFRAPLVYARPETWDGFWYVVTAEQFRESVLDPLADLPGKLADLARLAGQQFGPFAPLVPIALLASALARPRFALLTGSAMAITTLFAASYVNADIERYYLGPLLWAWAWLGLLAATIRRRIAPEPGAAPASPEAGAPPAARSPRATSIVALALAAALLVPTGLAFDERRVAADRSGSDSAGRWVDAVLLELEPETVLISWWSASTPLWYAQVVEGRRPDVFVVDDRTRIDLELGEVPEIIERYLGQRPVCITRLTSEAIDALRPDYLLTPLASPEARNVFCISGRVGGPS
jgi:hypothetical protein